MAFSNHTLLDLLHQVNHGQAAQALPEIEKLLRVQRKHPGLLCLHAEALRLSDQTGRAIEAYKVAGAAGAGARNWLAAGMLLAGLRRVDESLECLGKALKAQKDDPEILNALVTTLFNFNLAAQGVAYARRQLELTREPLYIRNAALLLHAVDYYQEASDAFRDALDTARVPPDLLGSALVPARFTCDWTWIGQLLTGIRSYYERGQFDAPQEFPLTHVTWCNNEAYNLEVTRAYVARTIPTVAPLTLPVHSPGQRLRVGYLSGDFCNHATMHLMAGVFECHDTHQFEIFAYDYSRTEPSDYRQRFLDAVEHHVGIHDLTDEAAAQRIANDQLDILIDLKGHTGWARFGIMAYRPAPLQTTWLGYPGSTAVPYIDYVIADRFVTPDDSAPFYTEKFCRLPHSYQCNDAKRMRPGLSGTRASYGLPDDKFVFCGFNQSYKVDRASFQTWLQVLKAVPDSVLWLLGQCDSAQKHLSNFTREAGIDVARLVFSPFAPPHEHLARLALADAGLDTLVCNGHTTTSDALWAGVPVITARGRHFASRVSESLLNAAGLPELVAHDAQDMAAIATRLVGDAPYRQSLRNRLGAHLIQTPLYDTPRFTRHLECGIRLMVEASGKPHCPHHIDVPAELPVQGQAPLADPDAPFDPPHGH